MNARTCTVANLVRIYIVAYSLALCVDLVRIQKFAHAFACSANLSQMVTDLHQPLQWCKLSVIQ